jgi:hypothetical protein
MARTCCNNRTLVAVTSVSWVLLLLTTLACAAKKYQTVQITNVHLHDSGAGVVDAYVTVQEGEFLFIADCGDPRRVTIPKAWVSGAKVQAHHKQESCLHKKSRGKRVRLRFARKEASAVMVDLDGMTPGTLKR